MDKELDNKDVTPIRHIPSSQATGGIADAVLPKVAADDIQSQNLRDALQSKNYFARHPVGFWFFFWGEFAERCSYYGMRAILARYMADRLGFGVANSNSYEHIFMAACYFLP